MSKSIINHGEQMTVRFSVNFWRAVDREIAHNNVFRQLSKERKNNR
jgi:hypothetical protein